MLDLADHSGRNEYTPDRNTGYDFTYGVTRNSGVRPEITERAMVIRCHKKYSSSPVI